MLIAIKFARKQPTVYQIVLVLFRFFFFFGKGMIVMAAYFLGCKLMKYLFSVYQGQEFAEKAVTQKATTQYLSRMFLEQMVCH